MAPRRAAFSTIVFGPSTWQVRTSTPWSIRLLVASASLTGIDQSPVKITCVVAFGLASLAPSVKALMLRSTCGIGLAATKPSLPVLRRIAGDDAGDVLRLVDIAEIAAGVLRVLVGPQAAAMLEAQLRIFGGHLDHVRVVVAERGREQQRRAVEIDHRLHGLLDRVGLRHLLLFDDLDARQLLQRRRALRMRLVVAVVVARTDIDEADRGVGGESRPQRPRLRRASMRRRPATDAVVKSCQNPSLCSLGGPSVRPCRFGAASAAEPRRIVFASFMPRPLVGERSGK